MACTPPTPEPQSRWIVYYNDGSQRVPIYTYSNGTFTPTEYTGLAEIAPGVLGLDYGFRLVNGSVPLFAWDVSTGRVVVSVSISTNSPISTLPRIEFIQKGQGVEMMIAYASENGLWVTRVETDEPDFIASNTVQFRLGGVVAIHPSVGLQCTEVDTYITPRPPAPTAFYRLDETSGTRYDSAGTRHLEDPFGTSYAIGLSGNAADLRETELRRAYDSGLNVTTGISCSFWFNPKTVNSVGLMGQRLTHDSIGPWRWVVQQSGESIYIQPNDTEYAFCFSDQITEGAWYHLAFAVDVVNKNWKLWLNGVPQTGTFSNSMPNAGSIVLGEAYVNVADHYMDMAGLWVNHLLTDGEVAYLYNGGAGRNYYSGAWRDP